VYGNVIVKITYRDGASERQDIKSMNRQRTTGASCGSSLYQRVGLLLTVNRLVLLTARMQ